MSTPITSTNSCNGVVRIFGAERKQRAKREYIKNRLHQNEIETRTIDEEKKTNKMKNIQEKRNKKNLSSELKYAQTCRIDFRLCRLNLCPQYNNFHVIRIMVSFCARSIS